MAKPIEISQPEIDSAKSANITISERAAIKIKSLLKSEPEAVNAFRVSVLGGGCSGFQYRFSFDSINNSNDIIIENHGVKVIIDILSANYLAGSEVDFTDDLIGATFAIKNPNATASCGCGTSFSIG